MSTMTDREMLELAAKAVGFRCVDWMDGLGFVAVGRPEKANILFNPLRNDGHALKLAVDLDMIITVNRVDGWTKVECGYSTDRGLVTVEIKHDDDMHAATRRAIVRAAAEIGRAMQ